MSNIMDYMEWRGDILFSTSDINEIDNLIFSFLSYVEFDDIVPDVHCQKSISLEEANRLFWERYTEEMVKERNINTWESTVCLRKMAECERFRNVRLSRYVNRIDLDEVMQFSAVTIEYKPGAFFIAFRGTDSSIVGWKEDFYLTFQTVAAEKAAENYLNYVGSLLPGSIILGGHSKGGNLAVYAAKNAHCQIQDKIKAVYINDGPGFRKNEMETERYQRIKDRVHSFVPETSIVGMLLYHEENYQTVKSSAAGFKQHECLSWQVQGPHFVYLDKQSEQGKIYDQALSGWIDSMSYAERKEFVEALFGALERAGIHNLNDLTEGNRLEIIHDILLEMRSDEEGMQVIRAAGKSLLEETAKSFSGAVRESLLVWKEKSRKSLQKQDAYKLFIKEKDEETGEEK